MALDSEDEYRSVFTAEEQAKNLLAVIITGLMALFGSALLVWDYLHGGISI